MRNSIRIASLFLALAAAGSAFSQQTLLYQVKDWGKLSFRDDGKGVATSFQWGVTAPASAPAGAMNSTAGKPAFPDASLSIPVGDAAVMFTRAALNGEHLPEVLVEFSFTKGDPKGPAPFAFRLSNVLVTSVTMGKSSQDGGPGIAEVKLNAQKVEFFSGNQNPKTGQVTPGRRGGYDMRAGKAF